MVDEKEIENARIAYLRAYNIGTPSQNLKMYKRKDTIYYLFYGGKKAFEIARKDNGIYIKFSLLKEHDDIFIDYGNIELVLHTDADVRFSGYSFMNDDIEMVIDYFRGGGRIAEEAKEFLKKHIFSSGARHVGTVKEVNVKIRPMVEALYNKNLSIIAMRDFYRDRYVVGFPASSQSVYSDYKVPKLNFSFERDGIEVYGKGTDYGEIELETRILFPFYVANRVFYYYDGDTRELKISTHYGGVKYNLTFVPPPEKEGVPAYEKMVNMFVHNLKVYAKELINAMPGETHEKSKQSILLPGVVFNRLWGYEVDRKGPFYRVSLILKDSKKRYWRVKLIRNINTKEFVGVEIAQFSRNFKDGYEQDSPSNRVEWKKRYLVGKVEFAPTYLMIKGFGILYLNDELYRGLIEDFEGTVAQLEKQAEQLEEDREAGI